jgi:hypothetical protein
MLHLPHVTELVGDQPVVRHELARAEEDRPVSRVAVEAAEPREPEEPRDDPDAHVSERDRPRIEVERVEARLRAGERGTLCLVHAATL